MQSSETQTHPPKVDPASQKVAPAGAHTAPEGWHVEALIFGFLLLISMIGIGIADFSAGDGLTYWLYTVPIFAAASIFWGWSGARSKGQNIPKILLRHALHWAPLPAALMVIYWLEDAGRLNRDDAGLVALLTLSLTTLLAGVHFDWRLALLGLLLGLAAVCSALVEEFFWMLLIPALAVGAVMILWRRHRPTSPASD